nr:tetratricopeptide repeat protein [Kibdelosporangium sp. MJ126-NF4]CEL20309.1 transcriptional regulator, SARP family [Kibdelosporangium sp. MJ126-NF4]CTQ97535.1 transcriptional regulator, SARP family [Kibdelosporangium sp. MJ126-NF4]
MTAFASALDQLLARRGLSWRKLARLTGYTPGWLIKIKNGAPPSAELARRCDEALEAGGSLIALTGVTHQGTQPVRPAQLPAATASFVGRKDELRKLAEALRTDAGDSVPVITIEGPPGTGKTALALRLAGDVAEHFPDGQLYLDLNGFSGDGVPVSPDQALEEFLGALEVAPDEIPARLTGKAALFRSVLAHRRVLVVLDNAAGSTQVQHLIPGGVGCAVVVTSRNRLSGLAVRTQATRIALGPLTTPDSVGLLTAMITGDRADDAEALAELSRRCAHVPLALRIAAEQVNNRPGVPVRDLAADLAFVDDDSAVRTVFSWSYRGLDASAARMFRLVSLHPGTVVCVSAAAALTGETHQRAQALLKSLAGMHLVEQAGRDWYRLHDLLRLYGRECSRREDSDNARRTATRQLTEWYLHSAMAANEALAPFRVHVLTLPETSVTTMTFDGPVSASRWCEAELPNVVPVARMAREHGFQDAVWQLAVAMFDYLLLRKPWGIWITGHELALDTPDRRARAWVATNLAVACRWVRDFDRCAALYADAMAVRRDIGDSHGQAWILEGQASLAIDRGQVEQARQYASQALELFSSLGDVEGQAASVVALSEVHRMCGALTEALALARRALRMCEEIDDLYGQGRKLVRVADVHVALGEFDEALACVDRSLEVRRAVGDRWGEADSLTRRGDILRDVGDTRLAEKSWLAALALYEELADPRAADLRSRLVL